MKNIALILFIAMCIAQWVVPGKMILDSERVISEGTVYKFKTQPIDPSDPFRGKYVILNFEANRIALPDSSDWEPGEEVFITFTTDSAGYATAEAISREEPPAGTFLRTTVNYASNYAPFVVTFRLPFDRFYLEESKASEAEKIYWQSQRDSSQVAYGLVSMGSGNAILKDVMINERSIVDLVNELNTNK